MCRGAKVHAWCFSCTKRDGGRDVAEVLVQFTEPVIADDGTAYMARACGSEMPDGLWQGWIEFLPIGEGEPIRSGRETTQPSRDDLFYWATGLTAVYLEGALVRALKPAVRPPDPVIPPPVFDSPANEDVAPAPAHHDAVLNPFSVYRKGESQLRRQLAALSEWHLVNIIAAYGLSDLGEVQLNRMSAPELIELIVSNVRAAEAANAR
jgi:hypothetical protein